MNDSVVDYDTDYTNDSQQISIGVENFVDVAVKVESEAPPNSQLLNIMRGVVKENKEAVRDALETYNENSSNNHNWSIAYAIQQIRDLHPQFRRDLVSDKRIKDVFLKVVSEYGYYRDRKQIVYRGN